jgi:MOSC domain-containing protein YiiM
MDTHLTTTDLETGLAELGTSPQDNGILEMIVCRPSRGERRILETADLHEAEGMIGDNWLARGSKSTPDGSANAEAQITLMNSRVIQAITQDRSRWALAGDQLYVDLDISEENLPPGQRIAIGTVILEISSLPHTGCASFTERFGHDAIRWVNSPEGRQQRRRGVNARIVQGGSIRQGDVVRKLP